MDTERKFNQPDIAPRGTRPHVVLVDDDPVFARVMQKAASLIGMRLTIFTSPRDAYRALPTMTYDIGLFDFDLIRVTGIQLCHFLARLGGIHPVVLISHLEAIHKLNWPTSVKRSLSKSTPPNLILAVAQEVFEETKGKDG